MYESLGMAINQLEEAYPYSSADLHLLIDQMVDKKVQIMAQLVCVDEVLIEERNPLRWTPQKIGKNTYCHMSSWGVQLAPPWCLRGVEGGTGHLPPQAIV